MSKVLGIHVGHHASCAVAVNGVVTAAIQQERITRIKHDGEEALTNRLPIRQVLSAASLNINDCDYIVSSFQTVGPSSFGLHKPLVEEGFDLFDPWSDNHYVISHHMAHAFHAFLTSGFDNSAVLVADLAGSSTVDGADFFLKFSQWYSFITGFQDARPLITESVSCYKANGRTLSLKERFYGVSHIQPMSFIWSPASLYSNLSRRVFGADHADGQLMALAAFGNEDWFNETCGTCIVNFEVDRLRILNNWQHKIPQSLNFSQKASIAAKGQNTLNESMNWYAARALEITGEKKLAAAGGIFLNILLNAELNAALGSAQYFVPSAPHDAGIAIGAALAGAKLLMNQQCQKAGSDRLGQKWPDALVKKAIAHLTSIFRSERADPSAVATMLYDGCIVGRCFGRSEFGPRALGGRSLLGSPFKTETKDKLNAIKSRQPWRPVAPIVLATVAEQYFHGRLESPWMLFAHKLCWGLEGVFPALDHPDGKTRAQTISRGDDAELCDILSHFERLSGAPILVNTSLNGPNQPIIECPVDALWFLAEHPMVDAMIMGDQLYRRESIGDIARAFSGAKIAEKAIISNIPYRGGCACAISNVHIDIVTSISAVDAVRLANEWRSPKELFAVFKDGNVEDSKIFELVVKGIIELRP